MAKEIEMSKEEADMQIFTAKEKVIIPEGKHTAYISSIELRKFDSFAYVDVYFKLTDVEGEPSVKYGFNANISDVSQLGQFLHKSGFKFVSGDEFTFAQMKENLLDKVVVFKTVNVEKSINGVAVEFAEIILATLNFAKGKNENIYKTNR